jgi:hypothetical protein
MAGIGSWGLSNVPRDLTDVLSTLVAQQPLFVKLFPRKQPATSVKHEWLEDVLKPRSVAYASYTQATGTFSISDTSGWAVGDVVRVKGDPALFVISTITANTSIVVTFLASNGSSVDDIGDVGTGAGTLIYDHTPVLQGSTSGPALFSQSGTEYNYTEILRGDVEISNTALATRTYGNENTMPYQLERAMVALARQLNNIALYGHRNASAPSAANAGRAGGLYFFGTQTGGLSVNGGSAALSLKMLNDAAQNILDAGGNPDTVVCGPGQARVISQLMRSQIQLNPGETQRGSFASQVISESTGQVMNVFIEPSMSNMDTDAWVIDSSSLGLSWLGNRELHSEPATAPGYDGQKWTIIGEATFEFKNAKQKLCRIKSLKASASALS